MGDQQTPSDSQPRNDEILLPVDQSQRIINREPGLFLFLSVSERPVHLGKGSKYDSFTHNSVHIFSESIALGGDLLSRQGISISCHNIIAASTKIITTGKDGDKQIVGVSQATNGAKGGPIHFYVQNGSSKASTTVFLVATGGTGGDATVETDRAGNGGDGGHLVRIVQSNASYLLGSITEFLNREDVSSKHLKSQVCDGDPVYSSAFSLSIIALKLTAAEETVKELLQPLDTQLSDIHEGIPCTVEELVRCIQELRYNLATGFVKQQGRHFKAGATYIGGYPGAGRGITGEHGKRGSDAYLFQNAYSPDAKSVYNAAIRKTTFAFAHPDQCAMLLDRAKVLYYMGADQPSGKAGDIFQRIICRLSFLPLTPSDPLYKAYMDFERDGIFPADSLSKLESIRKEAKTWMSQLTTGVGFNGHRNNWVPRMSYELYKDVLVAALQDHRQFEDAYIKYHAALEKAERLENSVGIALKQVEQMLSSLEADITDLYNMLDEAGNFVEALTPAVKHTHEKLIEAFELVKDKIKDDFELSVPQLVNALRSFAFSPTKGMAGVEALNLLYEGYTSVPDLDGRPVNKKIIIRKIERGEATVKNIKTTVEHLDDGTLVLDREFCTRLMTTEEDMMTFLEDFANSSFADVMEEMKEKFDAFINAIVARNEQILHYNIRLKLLVSKTADKKAYIKKRDELHDKQIDIHDPNLPAITSFMGDIYQSSRGRVMKLLDDLVRSLNFRMLTRENVFELAFSSGADQKDVPGTLTSVVLLNAKGRIEQKFLDSIGPNPPARFPPNFDDPSERGKRVHLSKSERGRLIKDRKVRVKIPVVYKSTPTGSDFTGNYNIRIYRARFGFTGLKLTEEARMKQEPARVKVALRHSGTETIVDRKNSGHLFTHDGVQTMYSFHLYPDHTIKIQDNGNISGADIDQREITYAAPGPFAEYWEIDLAGSQFNHLNFKDVTDMYFDFCGTDYTW